METEAHEEVAVDTGLGEASPVPWQFGCAIWVGAFAVVLWAMLYLFRMNLVLVPQQGPEDED